MSKVIPLFLSALRNDDNKGGGGGGGEEITLVLCKTVFECVTECPGIVFCDPKSC